MAQWTPIQGIKSYSLVLARKMGLTAVGWLFVYFISQKFRYEGDLNVLMLFAPMIGAIAGLVAGWYMATDSVEDSGFSGITLWIVLFLATCIPIWLTEAIMHLLLPKWPFGFGGWMLLSAATLIAMATVVWHSSSQG